MSAMGDFARLPTRQKVTVFVIIGVLLGLVYWQFIYKSLKEDVAAAESEHEQQKQLNKKLEADIPAFQKLKERMATLTRIIDENQKALPTEAELPAFFETLNRKVLESGVEVIRSRQGKEEPIETFLKVPIEYEIQGTFVQIKKFFASLVPKKKKPGQVDPAGEVEERERIVSIENLSLQNPVVKNREIRLTAKFTASTFRQEESNKDQPKPGAATKPTGAKPPAQAPAGTPTGARQRTEGAIDKADNRAKDAVEEPKPAGSGADRMKGGL